jgi:hypothetical protein
MPGILGDISTRGHDMRRKGVVIIIIGTTWYLSPAINRLINKRHCYNGIVHGELGRILESEGAHVAVQYEHNTRSSRDVRLRV